MREASFECGCKFPVIEDESDIELLPERVRLIFSEAGVRPSHNGDHVWWDIGETNPNCRATWELLGKGLTVDVFQLESPLGKQWCKKLSPTELEHIGALGAILRPGCLKAVDDEGVSMTAHFCLRKNGQEEVSYFHPALEPILKKTYGVLCYQEQSMKIAAALAGFNLQESDNLRKCITKETMFVSKTRGWISLGRLLEEGYKDDLFLIMGSDGIQSWKKIRDVWSNGKKNVCSIVSASGNTIRTTKNHAILTSDGWKSRDKLESHDYLIMARSVEFDGIDYYTLSEAILMVGMATEGYCTDYSKGGTFTNFNEEMMGYFTRHAEIALGEKIGRSSDGRVARLKVAHKNKLKELGFTLGLSHAKCLPDKMLGATKEVMREFLSFMLAAEGGITESSKQFEFSSKSLKMIHQVKLMMLRYGVRSFINEKSVVGYNDKYYGLYVNDLRDQQKLLKELTCVWPKEKRELLSRIIVGRAVHYTTDIIPSSVVKKILNHYPNAGRNESGSLYTENVSRERFLRVANRTNNEKWKSLAVAQHQYEQVKNVGSTQKEVEVFDFSMEDSSEPYIIANGFVIHNSIGKKLPEEMAKCKVMFMEGAKKQKIINEEVATQIWDWIEKSQRYAFNKSHAIRYGISGYHCAYAKAHFPLLFFKSCLKAARNSGDTYESIKNLVLEAKLFNIAVLPPRIGDMSTDFYCIGNNIHFGLVDIKGIGNAHIATLVEAIKHASVALGKPFNKFTWVEFLTHVASHCGESIVTRLIKAGTLPYNMHRQQMLSEYEAFRFLTDKELEFIKGKSYNTVVDLMKAVAPTKKMGGGTHTAKRSSAVYSYVGLLENPPTQLADSPGYIASLEEELLGVSLTCHAIEEFDLTAANTSCKEFLSGKTGYMLFGVEICALREYTIRKGNSEGQKMAFLTIQDTSCMLTDVCAFSDTYAEYQSLLKEGNVVILQGERDKKRDSLIVKKVWKVK